MVSIDGCKTRGIYLHDPLGDHKSDVFFLLFQLYVPVRLGIQNNGISLIKGLKRPFTFSAGPLLMGRIYEFKGRIEQAFFDLLFIRLRAG